jgi:hypothetical protein
MPTFDVRIYAVESDEYPGTYMGQTTVEADDDWDAVDKAKEELWDDRLSVTCDPRFMVNSHEAMALAAQFLDASPEDTMSVDEYDWQYTTLSWGELIDTGMWPRRHQHARNINLVPEKSDFSRPLVVSLGDGTRNRIEVWDGVHRTLSALLLGREKVPEVPAVVGKKNRNYGLMKGLWSCLATTT